MTQSPAVQHTLRKFINLMHAGGLISLPNMYKEVWKNQVHRYYSWFVVFMMVTHVVSVNLSLFIYSVHDLGEFCERFFETLLQTTSFMELCHLKFNLHKFLELLDCFEWYHRHHQTNSVIVKLQRKQEKILKRKVLTWVSGIGVIQPYLPKSESDLARIGRVYKLKYPKKLLATPMYIPFIDPSVPWIFYSLSIFVFFVGAVNIIMLLASTLLLPFCVYEIQAYHLLLRHAIEIVGREHRDASGDPVFHTNIMTGAYIVRDIPKREKAESPENLDVIHESIECLKIELKLDHQLYEYFYLRQIFEFQRELILLRNKLDSFYCTMMTVRYCLVFFLFLSCVYGSINPRLLPAKTHIKMCMEAFILLVVYFLFINCGEDLAGCNATLWSAMGRSQWYNCSKKTRQAIVVFFSFNQNMEQSSKKVIHKVMKEVWGLPNFFTRMLSVVGVDPAFTL
ncbi:hypothetical protein M8J75_003755 [Diaphorina citri]|nr:hypothetical protein M8J75_003755 [Diaphorina citri]